MSIIRHFKRVQYIDHMIKNKATGSLEEFARKNSLSKTTLSEILNEMKEMGFPIKYDRKRNSYYYEENGQMIKQLFLKFGEVLPRDELKQSNINTTELCFSPNAIFEPCKDL